MKILVTGSAGFIAGYLVEELLSHGYEVVGLDNFSKYGPIERRIDSHPRFTQHIGDAKDGALVSKLLEDCDHFVAGAAIIGGITLFHEQAYTLLAENERITATAFDSAITAFQKFKLKKITVISSSMVYESATEFPTPEGAQISSPPPKSTYGFQKLATEFFAKGAWEQYQLPYTIIRPFNCVGIGEKRALTEKLVMSGNIQLAMSHVVPDLVQKILKGQDPLRILGDGSQVRCYTYGGDLARGIRLSLESDPAMNQDFNLSSPVSVSVLQLAEMIWKKIHGDSKPFRYVSDPPYKYDVPHRLPDVRKALKILGFSAETPLDTALDEIIPWVRHQVAVNGI